MSTRTIGYILAALGAVAVLASILVDVLGFGDEGIQAAQLLGILAGLMIAMTGIPLALHVPERRVDLAGSLRGWTRRLLGLPVEVWFLVGFLITYALLFLSPVFFNADRRILYFSHFLPDRAPIGFDMRFTLEQVKYWVTTRQSPYPTTHYPPLSYVLLSPLTLLEYPSNYILITLLTFCSYLALTLLIPTWLRVRNSAAAIAVLAISGLFSYGFLFELERGQYYSIAFLLCMLAIYLFHRHHAWRLLAYVLFSVSVHLKIALIFLLPMFVLDWRDWRGNLKRMAGLALFNIALLFVLGVGNFLAFLQALTSRVDTPTFLWNGNHALANFVFNFVKDGYGVLPDAGVQFLQAHTRVFEWSLLAMVAFCILAIIVQRYRHHHSGFDPYLLLGCTLCALVIPVSVDYTLPTLVAPMAVFLSGIPDLKGSGASRIASILLLLVLSTAYASLLYPFKYKPYFLNNSFPALFLILVVMTMLFFLQDRDALPGEVQ